MNYLNGPLLAFMFPETDSRQLPLEAAAYWIQHALMCIIPIFLLRSGGEELEFVLDVRGELIFLHFRRVQYGGYQRFFLEYHRIRSTDRVPLCLAAGCFYRKYSWNRFLTGIW